MEFLKQVFALFMIKMLLTLTWRDLSFVGCVFKEVIRKFAMYIWCQQTFYQLVLPYTREIEWPFSTFNMSIIDCCFIQWNKMLAVKYLKVWQIFKSIQYENIDQAHMSWSGRSKFPHRIVELSRVIKTIHDKTITTKSYSCYFYSALY